MEKGEKEKKGEEERIGQWVSSFSSLSVETMPSPPRVEEVRIWLTWLRRLPATPKKKRGDTLFMKRSLEPARIGIGARPQGLRREDKNGGSQRLSN